MSTVNIVYKNINTTLHLHPLGETVSDCIRQTNSFFETPFLDYIYTKYPNHTHIIDIGANIGNHATFFCKYLQCEKVHCFEPIQQNIELLEKNLRLFTNKYQIYNCALSNTNGHLPLYNSQRANLGGFSLHDYQHGISFKVADRVEVKRLDSYNFDDNISMIKIDVENHENEVLEGAKNTIEKHQPIIFLENLHHGYPNIVPEKEPHQKILSSYGYKKVDSNIGGSYMDLWIPNK